MVVEFNFYVTVKKKSDLSFVSAWPQNIRRVFIRIFLIDFLNQQTVNRARDWRYSRADAFFFSTGTSNTKNDVATL